MKSENGSGKFEFRALPDTIARHYDIKTVLTMKYPQKYFWPQNRNSWLQLREKATSYYYGVIFPHSPPCLPCDVMWDVPIQYDWP